MIFDENIAPRSGTSSKIRQSCPAQLSQNSFGSLASLGSSILHESTRNFNNAINTQPSLFGQSSSLSKSSIKQAAGFSSSSGYEQPNHLSQSSYRQSEPILAKGSSVLSSVSARSSTSVRSSMKGEDSNNNNQHSSTSSKRNSGGQLNEVDENNNLSISSSRLRSSVQNPRNSLNPGSAILSTISQEESGSSSESGNMSQRSSLNASSMRKHSLQAPEQQTTTSRLSGQQQLHLKQSRGNTALKLAILGIVIAVGIAVVALNPGALQSISDSYSPINQQSIAIRNKFFEAQIDETLNVTETQESVEKDENAFEGQKENQLESANGKKGDSTTFDATLLIKESSSASGTSGGRIGYQAAAAPSSISQGSEAKLETLIEEEAESFYQTLVKVVQKEKSISWLQFEEYLADNGTASIIDRVRVKIQRRVDESLSIKEELNIQTGGRFYVSQEKL